MTISIRPGRPGDVAAALRLWSEADAEPSHTDDADSLVALVAHDPAALLVAEERGRIVGSVIAAWDGWRGSVYRLVVAPSHRRQGLARRLIGHAEARLSEAGAKRLQAIVVDTDGRATGFWTSTDWEQQAERVRFVKG
jgi:ribosomal protein S18 acetylase RimI-like enzyme